MRILNRLFVRIWNFTTGRRGDERLREEMEVHIAMQTEENIRAGMPPAEARRQAFHRKAGGPAARNGNVAGTEQVGNLEGFRAASLGAEFFHLGWLEAEDTDHAARPGIRGRLHGLTPTLHDAEPVLERQRSRKNQGRVLTQAEARRRAALLQGSGLGGAEGR